LVPTHFLTLYKNRRYIKWIWEPPGP